MDHRRFDDAIRALGAGASRRRILTGLAGLGTALAGAELVAAKKGGNGKGKNKDKDKDKGGGKGNAPGRNKVGICHRTGSGFFYKEVPPPALRGHLGHGDTLCPPRDADEDPCRTYAEACDDETGACVFDANEGAACVVVDDDGGETPGLCDAAGECAPADDPVTADLFEQGSNGTLTSQSGADCQFAGSCTDAVAGDVAGTPIDGSFAGTLTTTNFQQVGSGPTYTADAEGTVTLTDEDTDDTLTVALDGTVTGDGSGAANAPFSFEGTFTITGGTGRFAGATGSGTATAAGTDSGPNGTLDSVTLDGTITYS